MSFFSLRPRAIQTPTHSFPVANDKSQLGNFGLRDCIVFKGLRNGWTSDKHRQLHRHRVLCLGSCGKDKSQSFHGVCLLHCVSAPDVVALHVIVARGGKRRKMKFVPINSCERDKCPGQDIRPRRWAQTMAAVRLCTPIFSYRCERWLRTVFSEMPSSQAICALLAPSHSRPRASRSRWLREASTSVVSGGDAASVDWPVKPRTVSQNCVQAGSCSSRMWLREGSRANSAPAMPLARRRPSDTGTTWSPEACSTRVGVFTRGRNAQASISARAASSFTAVSGVVDLRHISLNQPSCSALPSGMKREVNS